MKSRSNWDRKEKHILTTDNKERKRDAEDLFVYLTLLPDSGFAFEFRQQFYLIWATCAYLNSALFWCSCGT
jgi:hypothetical protein